MADGRWGIFSEDGGGSKDGIKKGPIHAFFNDHPQAKKRVAVLQLDHGVQIEEAVEHERVRDLGRGREVADALQLRMEERRRPHRRAQPAEDPAAAVPAPRRGEHVELCQKYPSNTPKYGQERSAKWGQIPLNFSRNFVPAR